jgi:DNA-binding MarR family transcriptional regulator
METAKDLWASVVAYVNERTTNPLTSAFVLSWALWNYKFFVLLFSDESPSSTFAAIDVLYPRPDIYFRGGFLYPAITALIYVFIYPYITEKVVKFYRKRQVSIANTLKVVEEQRVRTVAEVTRMVRAHEKALHASNEETTNARLMVEELRSALNKAEDEIAATQHDKAKASKGLERITSDSLLQAKLELKTDAESEQRLAKGTETSASGDSVQEKNILHSSDISVHQTFLGPVTRRQLRILTLLTEQESISAKAISKDLDINQFWVDEELGKLVDQDRAVKTDYLDHVKITEDGRDLLRALINEGKWTIEESFSQAVGAVKR